MSSAWKVARDAALTCLPVSPAKTSVLSSWIKGPTAAVQPSTPDVMAGALLCLNEDAFLAEKGTRLSQNATSTLLPTQLCLQAEPAGHAGGGWQATRLGPRDPVLSSLLLGLCFPLIFKHICKCLKAGLLRVVTPSLHLPAFSEYYHCWSLRNPPSTAPHHRAGDAWLLLIQ